MEGGKEKTGERALFLSSFSFRRSFGPSLVTSHSRFALPFFVQPNCENLGLRTTLSKTDTFGTDTKCLSKSNVCLIESQITGEKKGRDHLLISV